jgi:hypothetical protein|tara:strand:+ start:27 stop:2090 length:2064 start_codon:yes stop_codon:yes gene_type:complete
MKKLLGILVLGLLVCNESFAVTIVDELTILNNLYKEGAITKEEFSKAKEILFKSDSTENKDQPKIIKKKKEITTNKEIKKKSVKVKNFDQDLSKTFISLEEVDELGTYKKIINFPEGMFKSTNTSFKALSQQAAEKMYITFVINKNLMEKYPENMMKGMGYFEIFYMQKLKDEEKAIEKFKKNYPEIKKSIKKKMQSLYSLNQARKSMRESIGLTLNDDTEEALKRYMHMHDFLNKGEKSTRKLTTNERKLKKESLKFKKYYGSFKKTVELKSEKRIDQKTFDKDIKKNIKDVKKSLNKLIKIDPKSKELYGVVSAMFEKSLKILDNCNTNCERKDLLTVIDSTEFTNAALKDVEKDLIKKKYTQDLTNVDMDSLSDKQKETLTLASLSMKRQKAINKEKLQNSVLNLDNQNFPIGEYLDKMEDKGFKVKSITMSFGDIDNMKKWETKDWANSWRGELPIDEFKDKTGNLIKLSQENIEDLKAQLAINNFNKIIDDSKFEINESMNEIAQAVKESGEFNLDAWLNKDFSLTLDNYVQIAVESQIAELENSLSADTVKLIRENANFENLTHLTNLEYGTNMTPEEYASYWESAAVEDSTSNWGDITRGVDLLSQVGSFEAASIAKDLGTDLQTIADSISLAASVGISTDLEAAASGLGYSSFADAVAAYNEQYGTNYTTEEAAEALGN